MNARTLAAVAIRIWALAALAGVLAACPPAAFYTSLPAGTFSRAGQIEMVLDLAVRFVVAVVLLVGAERIARWIVPDAPAAPGIGLRWLSRLAFSLVAVFLFVEAIERLAAPLHLLAMSPPAPRGVGSFAQMSQGHRDAEAVVRSIVMIVAAGWIFWRDRIARSLRSALAAVRRR